MTKPKFKAGDRVHAIFLKAPPKGHPRDVRVRKWRTVKLPAIVQPRTGGVADDSDNSNGWVVQPMTRIPDRDRSGQYLVRAEIGGAVSFMREDQMEAAT